MDGSQSVKVHFKQYCSEMISTKLSFEIMYQAFLHPQYSLQLNKQEEWNNRMFLPERNFLVWAKYKVDKFLPANMDLICN